MPVRGRARRHHFSTPETAPIEASSPVCFYLATAEARSVVAAECDGRSPRCEPRPYSMTTACGMRYSRADPRDGSFQASRHGKPDTSAGSKRPGHWQMARDADHDNWCTTLRRQIFSYTHFAPAPRTG